VLDGKVDREIAANASSNRHDFLIALERALKEQAHAAQVELEAVSESDGESEPEPAVEEEVEETTDLPRLRVAGQQ
jgi:hypothetical protein